MAKRDNKFYRYYRSHRTICNWVIVGILFLIAIGFKVAVGQLSLAPQEPVFGAPALPWFSVKMNWFSWVVVIILTGLLVLAIIFMVQNRSEAAQERNQKERVEAAKLQKEIMDERQQELEDSYQRMKERRAARMKERQAARNGGRAPLPEDAAPAEDSAEEPAPAEAASEAPEGEEKTEAQE